MNQIPACGIAAVVVTPSPNIFVVSRNFCLNIQAPTVMLVHNFIRTVGLSHKMPDLARIVRLCFGRCDIYSSVVFNKGSTACGLQIGAVKLDAGVEITAKITGHETRYILLADFYNLECLRFMEGASIHKTVATAAEPVLRELNISPSGNIVVISICHIKN